MNARLIFCGKKCSSATLRAAQRRRELSADVAEALWTTELVEIALGIGLLMIVRLAKIFLKALIRTLILKDIIGSGTQLHLAFSLCFRSILKNGLGLEHLFHQLLFSWRHIDVLTDLTASLYGMGTMGDLPLDLSLTLGEFFSLHTKMVRG